MLFDGVATGYLIEQGVCVVLSVCLFIISLIQLLVEPFQPVLRRVRIWTLKYIWHRVSFAASCIFLLRCVDPRGALGIYSIGVLELMADNCTALIICGICCALYLSLRPAFLLLGMQCPVWMKIVFQALTFCTFLFANFTGTVATVKGYTPRTLHGAWMAYLATCFLGGMLCFSIVVFQLDRFTDPFLGSPRQQLRFSKQQQQRGRLIPGHTRSSDPAAFDAPTRGSPAPSRSVAGQLKVHIDNEDKAKLRTTIRRLKQLQVVGSALALLGAITQILVAYKDFSRGHPPDSTRPARPDEYHVHMETSLVYLQFCAVALMVWHAWVRVCGLTRPYGQEPLVRESVMCCCFTDSVQSPRDDYADLSSGQATPGSFVSVEPDMRSDSDY